MTSLMERVTGPGDMARVVRYCAVSLITVPIGQGIIFLFAVVLDWPDVLANFIGVTASAIPAYLLYRKWVWGRDGEHSLRGEVIPFWIMAIVGLIASTLAVAWASERWDNEFVANIANLAAYGAIWIIKFVVLDRWLFARPAQIG